MSLYRALCPWYLHYEFHFYFCHFKIMCIYVHICTQAYRCLQRPEEMSDTLELELEALVSHLNRVLETELRFFNY